VSDTKPYDVTVMMVIRAGSGDAALGAASAWIDRMCEHDRDRNGEAELETAWIEFVEPTRARKEPA
jgi:hypothetical protein